MTIIHSSTLILADTGGGFSFSEFQRSFHEAWYFAFPNALMIALCSGVVWFVGRPSLPWIRIPWQKAHTSFRKFSRVLAESNLFGSKLLPSLVIVALTLAVLNVFSLVSTACYNVLPPAIITMPTNLYGEITDSNLILAIVGSDPSISSFSEAIDKVVQWDQAARTDADIPLVKDINYWKRTADQWHTRMGDIKILAATALVSCAFALRRKQWAALRRFIIVAMCLALIYLFCLTKHLFATEQRGSAVVHSLRDHYKNSKDQDWNSLCKAGLDRVERNKEAFEVSRWDKSGWWEMRWFDLYYYRHAVEILHGRNQPRASFSEGDLKYIREDLDSLDTNPEGASESNPSPSP